MEDIRASIDPKINRQISPNFLRVTCLVLLDSLIISGAWMIAEQLATQVGTSVNDLFLVGQSAQKPGLIVPILVINLGILFAAGLYGTDDPSRRFVSLVKSLTLAQGVTIPIVWLYQPQILDIYGIFPWAWVLSVVLMILGRWLVHWLIVSVRENNVALRSTVFLLGNPEDIHQAKQLLERVKQFRVTGVAYLSIRKSPQQWQQVLHQLHNQKVNEVFICSWQSVKDPILLFWELKSAGICLRILPIGGELPVQGSEIKIIGQLRTVRFPTNPLIGGDFLLKRYFDIFFACLLLLILSVPMVIIAIAIKLDSPGPIIYRQTRIGLKNQPFQIWKFRTMVANAAQMQKELENRNEFKGGVLFKLHDDPRITKVGKWLRNYSLDEFPQLINVIRGEMSLVGPRPLPMRDVEKMSPEHLIRHEILPGITGLWQVGGRSDVDSQDLLYLDLAYIQHWSLSLDCRILLKTIKVVLFKEGAY